MNNSIRHCFNRFILSTLFAFTFFALRAQSVYQFIASSPNHTTLTAAINAAGIEATLSGAGTFTVFAPTDDAFVSALTELGLTAEELLASEGLADILTYHVLGSTVLSTDLENGITPTPLNDTNTIKVTVGGSGVFVNQAQVTGPDNETGNGVVHVTDGVILSTETVVDVALSTGVHGTLVAAVIAAELLPALTNPFADFTVFAPTDDAFAEIPTSVLDALLEDPTGDLKQILLYHVVGAVAMSTDLSDGDVFQTLQGDDVTVNIDNSVVMINESTVTAADNEADNGVVHVIDLVLNNSTSSVDLIEGINNKEFYMYSVDLSGRVINQENLNDNLSNQIILDVYNTGKVIKRFVVNQ